MKKRIEAPSYSIIVFVTDDNSFNVTASLLVKGKHATLINAGFTRSIAKEIAGYVRDNGLTLDEVFIIHGDPDYYFGLEGIIRAFPNVTAYSTAETAAHITDTVLNKLKVWGEQLKSESPDNIVIPKILTGGKYNVLGETFEVCGVDMNRINLFDADNKVLIGGIDVFNELHVFLADTGTSEALRGWVKRLDFLSKLKAKVVIPSHGTIEGSFDSRTIEATADYLKYVLTALNDTINSSELSNKLHKRFPEYINAGVIELGAKVLTQEIIWN